MPGGYTAKDASGITQTYDSDLIAGKHHPRLKMQWGADGSANDTDVDSPIPVQVAYPLVEGNAHLGAVGGNGIVITRDIAMSAAASYVTGDFVGTDATPLEFAGAARVSTGTGTITGCILIDDAVQSIAGELWLFDESFTPPNDSAAWAISDADALKCIGVIPFSTYYASGNNSISVGTIPNGNLPFKSTGTSLWGAFVTRGSPTYASGNLHIRLFAVQD